MAEYKGSLLQVYYNTVELSGQGRSVSVNEEAGEPEEVDVTHRGDSSRQVLEGFPGRVATTVEVSGLDEAGGTANIYDFALNAKDTLKVYPEGRTSGERELTVQNARLITRNLDTPFDGAAEWTASFNAKNSVTHGTYSG